MCITIISTRSQFVNEVRMNNYSLNSFPYKSVVRVRSQRTLHCLFHCLTSS